MRQNAHPGSDLARFAALVWLGALGVASLPAQGPAPDPVLVAVEPLLQAKSAEMRGEAALVVAASGEEKYYAPLLGLAEDPKPAARHRAILALGFLGRPGADVFLGRIAGRSTKDPIEHQLAALALGLLPDEPRAPAIDAFFNRAEGASRKRIRAELVSMLVGFRRLTHPQRASVLRRFLNDATYRNRAVLALVIANLARVPGDDEIPIITDQLRSHQPLILRATLDALARPGVKLDEPQRQRIAKLAEQSSHSAVRTAAMQLLSFHRHPDALAIAGRGIRSGDPAIVETSVHTIVKLGGGLLRKEIENRILATKDPTMQAAMLRGKQGPHSDSFVEACVAIARDGSNLFDLRVDATKIAAEAGWKEIIPTATRLFLDARRTAHAESLARSLHELAATLDANVLPRKTVQDAELLPMRLRALLRTGSTQAIALLVGVLEGPTSDAQKIDALRAYRCAHLDILDDLSRELVEPAIREILAPNP